MMAVRLAHWMYGFALLLRWCTFFVAFHFIAADSTKNSWQKEIILYCIMLGRVANSGASSAAARMNASSIISRLRSPTVSSSNINRRHQFSTLQAIPQHFLLNQPPHYATGLPSCRDEEDDDNDKTNRTNNTLRHSSAKINNHWNTITTPIQHNHTNINLTILRQYHTTLPQQRGVA